VNVKKLAQGRLERGNAKRQWKNTTARLSPKELLDSIDELGRPRWVYSGDGNYRVREFARSLRRHARIQLLLNSYELADIQIPERVHTPNLSNLAALERELRQYPTRRRLLTIAQFGVSRWTFGGCSARSPDT
jgi:hypothetical protein